MVIFAFACLGFLVGNLIGLSAESALSVLLPILFTFGGGSAVAFLPKLEASHRRPAAGAVVALSLSCLVGAYTGIIASEYQFFSPTPIDRENRGSVEERKYLRTVNIQNVQIVDQAYKAGNYSSATAYEKLYRLISDAGAQ